MSAGDTSTDDNTETRGYGIESNNQHELTLRINNQTEDANNSLVFADDPNFHDSERTQIDDSSPDHYKNRKPVLKTFDRDLSEENDIIISSPTQRDRIVGLPIASTQTNKTRSTRDKLENTSLSNSMDHKENNYSKLGVAHKTGSPSPADKNPNGHGSPLPTTSPTSDTQRILPLSYDTGDEPNTNNDQSDHSFHPQRNIEYADTQVIHNNQNYKIFDDTMDTQIIRHPNDNDTQVIHKNYNDDTQVIVNPANGDTQVIPRPSNVDSNDFEINDTRFIGPSSDSKRSRLKSTPKVARENSGLIFSPDSQTKKDEDEEVQIPRTIEQAMRSTTQVVNTQEEITLNDTFEQVDLGTKPVYSSSSQFESKNKRDDMIIQSDDEDIKDMIENNSGLIYDDSIFTHRQLDKKRKKTSADRGAKKSIKIEPQRRTRTSTRSRGLEKDIDTNNDQYKSDNSSDYDVITESHIVSTPVEEQDNVDVTTTDIMNILEPTKSNGLIKTLPSSPTNIKDVSAEVTDLSQSVNGIKIDKMEYDITRASSDLEDFDDTYRTEEIDNVNDNDDNEDDNVIVTRNRSVTRKNFVAQSQTDSSRVDQTTSNSNDSQAYKLSTQSQQATSQSNPQQVTSQAKSPQATLQPTKGHILREEVLEVLTQNQIVNIDSVFASYKFKIYTGVITRRVDSENLMVKFSEGEYDIKNSDLFLLDIRIGDLIELRGRSLKYIVTGLSNNDEGDDIKCMRGFNYVYLTRNPTKTKTFPEFGVPLSDCSMEFSNFIRHQQFNQVIVNNHDILKDNFMSIGDLLNSLRYKDDKESNRNVTPPIENVKERQLDEKTNGFKNLFNSPALLSRITSHRVSPRKQKQFLQEQQQQQQHHHQHSSDQQQQLVADTSGKLFSETLFFMTSIDDDEKQNMIKIIIDNGGVIIEESLSEILQYYKTQNGNVILRLDKLKGFKFGAIIASSYCRSAKYLQGLALGWPILSRLFIYDCVEDSHKFNHWPMYLLPAGQSSYLQSIKSVDVYRFRYNFEINNFVLGNQLQNNTGLLKGYTIMMLSNNRQNLATLETCEFIFYCFGVEELVKFNNCDQMLKNLELRCDTNDSTKFLIYTTNEIAERQLKCNDGTIKLTVNQRLQNLVKVGVTNWEWVVQCVISQYIWEPRRYVSVKCNVDK